MKMDSIFKMLSFLILFYQLNAANIGLVIMATGKYIQFVEPLINSAQKYFCKEDNVTYFIFTDQEPVPLSNTVYTYQDRLGWPFDTMNRYHTYYKNREIFEKQDFLFATDADMLFVANVGREILGDRVATIHPGFINKRGSYETRKKSKAYVNKGEGKYYFAGGFYGGSKGEFLRICKTNADNIDSDLSQGIVAVWHDESHWNRYCIDQPPTVILSPSYCYPENWKLNYEKKLLALDKNHEKMRE